MAAEEVVDNASHWNGFMQIHLVGALAKNDDAIAVAVDMDDVYHLAHDHLRNSCRRGVYDRLESARSALEAGHIKESAGLVRRAKQSYKEHVTSFARGRYLLGVLVGVIFITAFEFFLQKTGWLHPLVGEPFGYQLVIFAGMGAFSSILVRLNKLDLGDRPDGLLVLVSGAGRFLVAVFTAIAVYVTLASGILAVQPGGTRHRTCATPCT
jgi:hypothetical protein